jgi:UDP-N-acetylglucosamine 4-epimerase
MYKTKYHKTDLSKISVLVTGGAGFIGSNIVEYLIKYRVKKVRVLDNFATGFHHNINEFKPLPNFELLEGDIRDLATCKKAVDNVIILNT